MKKLYTKRMVLSMLFLAGIITALAKDTGEGKIYLLIRGDDMGSSHAANLGCIESYTDGIMRSVELMPCCPWFLEAVKMLNDNPGLDVGIHLTLTSEWSMYKWRPITQAQSLIDSNGYFFPMVKQLPCYPLNTSIEKADWKIEEVEIELRAQIKMALKHVPHCSHITGHMGFESIDPKIRGVIDILKKEYGLEPQIDIHNFKRISGWKIWGKAKSLQERIDIFCKELDELTAGYYVFVDHPAKNTLEMESIWHKGYENVVIDRAWVTAVFTSDKVKETIERKGINLINFKDFK